MGLTGSVSTGDNVVFKSSFTDKTGSTTTGETLCLEVLTAAI
jgi:hypothetical protein